MAQHKWHKEIKAWADGAEIEYCSYDIWSDWSEDIGWYENYEYRIKPQPKEPQYLYVYYDATEDKIQVEIIECGEGFQYIGKIKMESGDGN